MLSSSVLRSLFTAVVATTTVTAQALSSSPSIVLYPYITSGSLTGPYTNQAIDRTQPLATLSGYESSAYTSDCFNRFTFTSYIGTHCYGQDQCGFRRWSINATNPDPDCNTIITVTGGYSSMLISGPNDVDELGRRDVGWSQTDCDTDAGTPGFSIDSAGEQGILHLRYDNPADQSDEFGTFFTCWIEGGLYGPRVFSAMRRVKHQMDVLSSCSYQDVRMMLPWSKRHWSVNATKEVFLHEMWDSANS